MKEHITQEQKPENDCTAFCNNHTPACVDCPKLRALANEAFEKARGESVNFWSMPDDDPEVKYWKEIWIKGYRAHSSEIERLTLDRDEKAASLKHFTEFVTKKDQEIERLTKENGESLRQRNSFQGMYDFTLKENTNLRAEIERLREALRESRDVLQWHLDKSQPQNYDDQSDFFNMTANAINQAETALQPQK